MKVLINVLKNSVEDITDRGKIDIFLKANKKYAIILWFPGFLRPYGCSAYECIRQGPGLERAGFQAYKRGAGEHLQLFLLLSCGVQEEAER